MLSVRSSEWGPQPPPPHQQASVALAAQSHPFETKGGDTLVCGGGCGGPNSDEGTGTLRIL
jgi:hypothetical protein